MKKALVLITLPVCLMATSCGDSIEDVTTDSEEVVDALQELDYSRMSKFDMTSEHQCPITLMLPKGADASVKPEVIHNRDFTWEIKIGTKFHITIDDFGDVAQTVVAAKEQLENSAVYSYEYLDEGENFFLYSKTLPTDEETKTSSNYGFYYTDVIDGINYSISSFYIGDFRKDKVEEMLLSARSLSSSTAPVDPA